MIVCAAPDQLLRFHQRHLKKICQHVEAVRARHQGHLLGERGNIICGIAAGLPAILACV